MRADDRERTRQIRRASREASIRGLLLVLIWTFRVVAPFMGIVLLVQSWEIATGKIAPDEVDVVRYQTRNGFIAVGVMIALLVFFEWVRARFERGVAAREAVDPLPDRAWEPVRLANRIKVLFYLWVIRGSWPIFFGLVVADSLGVSTPPMATADRTLFLAIGGAVFLLWVFVARTRGPWTLNRGGRLERKQNTS